MHKLLFLLTLVVSTAMSMLSCESKLDDIGPYSPEQCITPDSLFNKKEFKFTKEGGNDSLYMKGHQGFTITSFEVFYNGKVNKTFSSGNMVVDHPTTIKDERGNSYAQVEYDGDLIKKITFERYTFTLQYNQEGKPKGVYLIQCTPEKSSGNWIIITGTDTQTHTAYASSWIK